MPRTLREVGLTESDLPRLAEAVMHDIWTRTNPRPIRDARDVVEFLHTAL
jgi:alcohol dehydrogenase class IV